MIQPLSPQDKIDQLAHEFSNAPLTSNDRTDRTRTQVGLDIITLARELASGQAPTADQHAAGGVESDPVVEANCALLQQRSQVGIKKYGAVLPGALTRRDLVQHALEEALDLANYLQADLQMLDGAALDSAKFVANAPRYSVVYRDGDQMTELEVVGGYSDSTGTVITVSKPVAAELPELPEPDLVVRCVAADAILGYSEALVTAYGQQCADSRPAEMTLERLRLAEAALVKNGFKRLDDIWVSPSVDSRPAGRVADWKAAFALHYPAPDTPHTSIKLRHQDDERAFKAGWREAAATLAASAAQPAANQTGFEAWAASHGELPLDRANDQQCVDGWLLFPTYKFQRTEIAWRAWANKPAASAVQAGAVPVEQPKECWSADEEDYNALSLGELIDRNEHLKPGMTVHTGEAVTPDASDLYDGSDIIDQMADRAHDIAGEYAEGYPEVGPDEVAKLTGMIQDWITKNCPPRFYTIKNIKPYVLTEADFAAAPNNTEG